MVTNLKLLAKTEQVTTVGRYLDIMKIYHEDKKDYLQYAIEQLSLSDKIGGGALAALLGVGAGAGAFAATRSSSQLEAVAAGSLSTVLGALVSYTAYQAWIAYEKKPADDNSREEFDKEMKKAGFNEAQYKELSAEVVKLLHFRECILLGLKDDTGTDMGQEFKTKLKEFLSADVDQESLKVAIEVYFLDQLNQVFDDAFKKIYKIHDEEIERTKEAESNPIIAWIKKYFEDPEERKRFTQQMQIEFMKHCINYLKSEMNEPGFLNRHPYLISSLCGLIAGSLAIGIASIILGGPVGIGVIAIALVITCFTALATYFIATHVKSFKRDEENRHSIQKAIDLVTEEKERLNLLMKVVTETTTHDLKQLAELQDKNENGFTVLIGLDKSKNIAMGASLAWIREHASRYRHSKLIEIDLEKIHREIIAKADKQTTQMQNLLIEMMSSNTIHPEFKKFISDTQSYLQDETNKEFITNFDLIQKVKEQVLQIVAVIPVNSRREFPQELVSFYTQDLGGSAQDLYEVRKFKSFIATEVKNEQTYEGILKLASDVNTKVLAKESQFILGGNFSDRERLGLRVREEKINGKNIERYLKDSYEFLLSLLDYENQQVELNEEYLCNDEFVLYRMLLIKQLASLADPNNQHTDIVVREKVRNFAQNTLNINPVNGVFNQFIAHDLLYQGETSKLDHMTNAIILSLTYTPEKISPKVLINQEMSSFLQDHSDEMKLFYDESKARLRPEASSNYVLDISKTINTTKQFIAEMKTKPILLKSRALEIYIKGVIEEVNGLLENIEKQMQIKTENLSFFDESATNLRQFKLDLSQKISHLTSTSMHELQTDTSPKLDQKDLEQFISAVKDHFATLKNSFQSSEEEVKATVELLTALRALQVGHVDYEAFHQISSSMHLHNIVSNHLLKMGYDNLDELFASNSTAPYSLVMP